MERCPCLRVGERLKSCLLRPNTTLCRGWQTSVRQHCRYQPPSRYIPFCTPYSVCLPGTGAGRDKPVPIVGLHRPLCLYPFLSVSLALYGFYLRSVMDLILSLQNKDTYEPFCKVPVITSSKEEQRLIATSNKVSNSRVIPLDFIYKNATTASSVDASFNGSLMWTRLRPLELVAHYYICFLESVCLIWFLVLCLTHWNLFFPQPAVKLLYNRSNNKYSYTR